MMERSFGFLNNISDAGHKTYSNIQESLTPRLEELPPAEKVAVRRRAAVEKRGLQRRARALAESEYGGRELTQTPATSPRELKKRMRNKSAFISRQTNRHYERLLGDHITRSESERNALLHSCTTAALELDALRAHVQNLEAKIESISASSVITDEPHESDLDLVHDEFESNKKARYNHLGKIPLAQIDNCYEFELESELLSRQVPIAEPDRTFLATDVTHGFSNWSCSPTIPFC